MRYATWQPEGKAGACLRVFAILAPPQTLFLNTGKIGPPTSAM